MMQTIAQRLRRQGLEIGVEWVVRLDCLLLADDGQHVKCFHPANQMSSTLASMKTGRPVGIRGNR